MARAICPACKGSLDFDRDIEEGEFFNCFHCSADLELISLHPLVLDWADYGFENVSVTTHWQASAKGSKRDWKRTRRRASRDDSEFDYVD